MKRPKEEVVVSVPWPVRLLGDLQDSLGMPSVAVALDLRTGVVARPRSDDFFRISGKGLAEPVTVETGESREYAARLPSFAKALRSAAEAGLKLKCGYDLEIHTRVPGLDSLMEGPAATMAWLSALLELGGVLGEVAEEEVAEMARAAMAGDRGSSWGAPEIYTCVLGGVNVMEWRGKPFILPMERATPGIVLGYFPGGGSAPLESEAKEVAASVERLLSTIGSTSFETASFDEVVGALRRLDEADARACYALLRIREHCRTARALLDGPDEIDDDRLGEALDGTHEMLRDYLGFDEEGVESLIDAANEAGALGSKCIPGTSLFVAFAPGKEGEVVEAVRAAGGRAHSAAVAGGIRVEARGEGAFGK